MNDNFVVAPYVNSDGDWDFQRFKYAMPENFLLQIMSVVPPDVNLGLDMIYWEKSNVRSFSIKSAYNP